MANEKVGVNLKEGVGVSQIAGISTAISGIIGNFERGPLNTATLVTSMSQFESIFGKKPAPATGGSTGYYSVKAFFRQVGEAPLYVVRVASSTAAAATNTFNDGGAAATLKVDAKSEGSWGNKLEVDVNAYNILSTTIASDLSSGATSAVLSSVEGLEVGSDVEIADGTNTEYVRITAVEVSAKTIHWSGGLTNSYLAATPTTVKSQEFELVVYDSGVKVETNSGLGMNPATTFFVESALQSNYIVGSDVKVTKANTYADLPAPTASPTALASGLDGLSDVTESDYSGVEASKTGVYALDEVEGLFRFCCPDPILTDADVPTAYQALTQNLMDYADARVTVTYYTDTQLGKTVTQAVTFAQNFASRRLIFFWPWIKVIEGGLDTWLPSAPFVMGAAVAKDSRVGVHKSVGNEGLAYAIDLEYYVSRSEGETLNDAGVNTVRKFTNTGIRTYGGRTRSGVTAWRFIHYSELWNYIGRSVSLAVANVPFEPNDNLLWGSVRRRVSAFLERERRKGALYDSSNPTGTPYVVKMDSTNNPADQVALGIAKVEIEYVPVGTVEKFIVAVTSSPSGLSIS